MKNYSSYRNENIRFGTADYKEPINGEVIEYTLSPEQLEAYRNAPKREQIPMKKPFKFRTKGATQTREVSLTKEMYVKLKAEKKSDKIIMKEYGLHSNLLVKLKFRWGIGK